MVFSYALVYLILSLFISLIFWSNFKNGSSKKRPPGPKGWPVIGNIFDFGTMPHENLYKLQPKYGPILWLKLGSINTLVINSTKAASELFKKHDANFSDRRVPDSLTACDYNLGTIALARYGEYSRAMRRLCSTELLVHKRITASAPSRQICIDNMINWIKDDSLNSSEIIQLDEYLVNMSFNLVAHFMLSKDIIGSKSENGDKFFEEMNEYIEWNGKPNLVDSFPILRRFDPQGVRKNTAIHLQRLLDIIEVFVKERIEEKVSGKEKEERDFLDALLEYEGEGKGGGEKLSVKMVTTIIFEMFSAGTETTSSTIHWTMAELLHNPDTMEKLKAEIDRVIGRSRKVEEGDLNELPYLQAVVKESMRLHPSLPFLLPRNSMQETEFMGYNIPKDTMVLLNVWAIHRDPESWAEDPPLFNPNRFLNSNIDSKGQHFELIPFGSGRRSCIGMLLGDKMVSLTLARLVQSFDWELPVGVTAKNMDMREKMGISLRKLEPLKVIPKERKY